MTRTNANLFSALTAAFPTRRSACAVETDTGLHYSWQDLLDASAMLANLLGSLKLPAASRIAVQVDKSVEALMLYLATLRAGHIFVPLNTAYQSGEMAYFLQDAQAAVLVCSSANLPWLQPLADAAGTRHVFTLNDNRTGTLLEAAARQRRTHTVAKVQPQALAAIIYTSGTTGRSKGAMLSHANLRSNAEVLQRYWDWKKPGKTKAQGGDVLIHALPIFHVHGLFVAIHGALLNGSKMIWCAKFDPRKTIAYYAQATVMMGVPTLYVRMLAESTLTPQATRGMRLFISGSAPMLVETHEQWRARTGHTILERYGMSETAMLTSNPCKPRDGTRRIGTVGPALPGVQLRIVDDAGQPVADGEIGGIQVKGPNVFQGYWQMPEKTAEEFTADGFFKTGDVGKRDPDGYVTIVGRSKDLIISGGYNVYPAEVEGYINNLPGVEESAVVGAPHPDFGEVGVAVVVPRAGAKLDPDSILTQLKAQLAHFKVPKRCVVVTELPRNAMGKVQKNVLRERYA
ncbi:MAG: malonyl-CoA synthase [Rhodoferax sp.]|nr:MAG: malonyl-CoA synthase [Rhodoferax sp.]